jgi:hypothetical protein
MCCSSFLDAVDGTWLIGEKANVLECQQRATNTLKVVAEPTDKSISLVTIARVLPILSTTQITVLLV